MTYLNLPKRFRPEAPGYRRCSYGIDLPRDFCDNLQQIDNGLYPVFHAYRLLWDDIINDVPGGLEDPRYVINYDHGHLNFGFVLKQKDGTPAEDGSWHVWRLCEPHGWAHIVQLKSREGAYLQLVLKRLKLQADWTNKYGFRSYQRLLEEGDEAERIKAMSDREELMNAIQHENEWLLHRAADNFERGKTAPTRPKKDVITSYAGQKNRSKITRDITDREGGLILPE